MSKYHADWALASNPGRLRLSLTKFRRLEPPNPGMQGPWTSHFATREVFEDYLDEHLQIGDTRAACVVSIAPLLVAAYTDELDCVVLLAFPDWLVQEYGLTLGSKLLTVNTYFPGEQYVEDLAPGPRHCGRYVNFYPIIADFVSDDRQRIAVRKSEIPHEEWLRCQQMGLLSLQQFPDRWRHGSAFWCFAPAPQPSQKAPWWKFWA